MTLFRIVALMRRGLVVTEASEAILIFRKVKLPCTDRVWSMEIRGNHVTSIAQRHNQTCVADNTSHVSLQVNG